MLGVDLGGTLSLVSVIVSVAGGVGLALGVLFSARCRGVIDLLRSEVDAQARKIDRLETERSTLDDRLKNLEADKRALADLASGATAVAQLAEAHRSAHRETLAVLEALRLAVARPAARKRAP